MNKEQTRGGDEQEKKEQTRRKRREKKKGEGGRTISSGERIPNWISEIVLTGAEEYEKPWPRGMMAELLGGKKKVAKAYGILGLKTKRCW